MMIYQSHWSQYFYALLPERHLPRTMQVPISVSMNGPHSRKTLFDVTHRTGTQATCASRYASHIPQISIIIARKASRLKLLKFKGLTRDYYTPSAQAGNPLG